MTYAKSNLKICTVVKQSNVAKIQSNMKTLYQFHHSPYLLKLINELKSNLTISIV